MTAKRKPESTTCNAEHPYDPQRKCNFDGSHLGQPHADGYGDFPEPPAHRKNHPKPPKREARIEPKSAQIRQQRAQEAEEAARKSRAPGRIRVFIDADTEEALQQALTQAGFDLGSDVKESHYSRNPHQGFDMDYRRDVPK